MINIVDRIGKTHKIGELVYAYFDTLTEKYIVLDKHPEPVTPMVYGTYVETEGSEPKKGSFVVKYSTGMDACDEDVPTVYNKLNLPASTSSPCPAIAVRMEKK